MPSKQVERSKYQRIRRLTYLARSLCQHKYLVYLNSDEPRAIFNPEDPRAFRRAFVEALLPEAIYIKRSNSDLHFCVGDKTIAKLNRRRELKWTDQYLSPIALDPGNIDRLVFAAHEHVDLTLRKRYRELTGFKLDMEEVAGGYVFSRKRLLRRVAINKIKAFCAELEPDAIATLRMAQFLRPTFRHAAQAVTHVSLGRLWRQAIATYPAAIHWAMAVWHESPQELVPLFDAIDNARPLVPELAKLLKITETQLRRFRGLHMQRVGPLASLDALTVLTELPPHLRPIKRADYRAARELCTLCDLLRPASEEHSAQNVREQVRSLTVGMKVALGQDARLLATAGLRDVIASISQFHGQPEAARLHHLSLGRIVDLNRDWHRAHREITTTAAKIAREPDELHWPRIVDEASINLGMSVAVELTSPSQLMAEGHALNHCVGGYYPACYSGGSRIFSLRSALGTPSSTVEIARIKGALKIAQHFAYDNRQPTKDDRLAAALLLRRIRASDTGKWPRLKVPPSAASQIERMVRAHMQKFFAKRFPDQTFIPRASARRARV